jgi:ribosomal protein L18
MQRRKIAPKRKMQAKRELIDTGTNKLLVAQCPRHVVAQVVDVSRSLSADRRQHSRSAPSPARAIEETGNRRAPKGR